MMSFKNELIKADVLINQSHGTDFVKHFIVLTKNMNASSEYMHKKCAVIYFTNIQHYIIHVRCCFLCILDDVFLESS